MVGPALNGDITGMQGHGAAIEQHVDAARQAKHIVERVGAVQGGAMVAGRDIQHREPRAAGQRCDALGNRHLIDWGPIVVAGFRRPDQPRLQPFHRRARGLDDPVVCGYDLSARAVRGHDAAWEGQLRHWGVSFSQAQASAIRASKLGPRASGRSRLIESPRLS